MCTTDIYPFISQNGVHRETREIRRCTAFRRGIPCDPIVYKHPISTRPPPVASPSAPTAPVDIPGASIASPRYSSQGAYFPPSPRLTPGQNTPATHESDSDGDRSASSSASRERRRQRERRPSIYVNGQRVETPPSPSTSRHQSSTYRKDDKSKPAGTRIIIVEAPPTPRTPPQAFDAPRTAPPSPSFVGGPMGQDNLRNRPVIVDERPRPSKEKPRVRIEVPGEESSSSGHSRGHRRQTSDGSHHSRGSSSYNTSDEERRHRRKEKERGDVEEEARRHKREARIAQANRKISLRPTNPMPSRRPATYVRPTVEIHPAVGAGMASSSADMDFAEQFGSMDIGHGSPVDRTSRAWAHRPAPVIVDEQEEEEEAQRQRLKERMMPRRRATIGAGSRRHRVEYQDGMYRLE